MVRAEKAKDDDPAPKPLTDVLSEMKSRGIEIPAKDKFEERYRDLTGFSF